MRFTLITEGASENRIIKHIIVKCFREYELFFRDAQPQIINGKQETTGGWNEVLKYCSRTDDLKEIFNDTDYLIIQIDTDQSQTKPFEISHTKPGNSFKTVDELHDDVIEKLKGLFDAEILEAYEDRIFFAICVHTIECWLLPVYFTNNHKTDTRNCLSTLNSELRRKDISAIQVKDKNSPVGIRSYETVLKNWRKKQDLINSAQHNNAFKKFIDSLTLIEQTLKADNAGTNTEPQSGI
jgi:hypothetical protein